MPKCKPDIEDYQPDIDEIVKAEAKELKIVSAANSLLNLNDQKHLELNYRTPECKSVVHNSSL